MKNLPQTIKKKILECFTKCQVSFRWERDGFFNVTDEVSEWLTENLGLTSCCNETEIGEFVFRFDWNCQRWMVK